MEVNIQEQLPSIKLIKGQKDTYGWEIKVFGKDLKKIVEEIEIINNNLLCRFCRNPSQSKK